MKRWFRPGGDRGEFYQTSLLGVRACVALPTTTPAREEIKQGRGGGDVPYNMGFLCTQLLVIPSVVRGSPPKDELLCRNLVQHNSKQHGSCQKQKLFTATQKDRIFVSIDVPVPLHVCGRLRTPVSLTLMEEPSGTTREFWPLVSRSGVLSPSEMVYRNESTPSLLPPDTYTPSASGPELSSKIRVPWTFCGNDNNIVVFKMKKKNNNNGDVPKCGIYKTKGG